MSAGNWSQWAAKADLKFRGIFCQKLHSLNGHYTSGLESYLNGLWLTNGGVVRRKKPIRPWLYRPLWVLRHWASDEWFSAGDKSIESTHSNLPPFDTATLYICTYQRLSSRTYLEMIATHRYKYSLLKTDGSYHAFVLNSKKATPTKCISKNSVLCWTKQPSTTLSW